MTDTRPFKLRATKEHTKNLLSWGRIEDPENNYVDEDGNWVSSKDAHVSSSLVKPVDSLYICASHLFEKVYLDELPQDSEDKVADKSNPYATVNLGKTITSKFIMQAQAKHADDLISYGMTIPGEIFVYIPSPEKPIDGSNPLCFVSKDKASEFSSWPEGVSRACFFPVYKVSVQLPGIVLCSDVTGKLITDHLHCGVTSLGVSGVCDPSLDKYSETNMKSLDKYPMPSLDKYLLDLQSDMLYLSEAIVAALECLRDASKENSDSFVKAYNKYRSKRGHTVLGED